MKMIQKPNALGRGRKAVSFFDQKWPTLTEQQKQKIRDKARREHMSLSAVMNEWPSIIDDVK